MSFRPIWAVTLAFAVGAAGLFLAAPTPSTTVSIDFSDTQGLYVGNEVRVLGVNVGKVTAIKPHARFVRVTTSVDREVRLPARASAVIIAPNLVGGRYVQLTPVYTSGQQLADGAHIPITRTSVPVPWDQVKKELGRLTSALGPQDGERRGPLAELVHGAAAATEGNGEQFAKSLRSISQAAEVLAAGTPDMMTAVRNLNALVDGLNASDKQMTALAGELQAVSEMLDANERQLVEFISSISRTVKSLKRFTAANRQELRIAIDRVTDVVSDLDDLKVDIANVLHLSPNSLANLNNIYNPATGAFTGRPIQGYTTALSSIVCELIYSAGGSVGDCRRALGLVVDQLGAATQAPDASLANARSGAGQGGTR